MSGPSDGAALAAAAEALVGARFRLHGRDPATGLDCVGVLAAALAAIGRGAALPTGYALRSRRVAGLPEAAARCGLGAAQAPIRAGDVLLLRIGPCQHHLAIAARGGGFVHAHAGLRRVVRAPAPLAGRVLHHWRLL
jgi:cell wall-associated NlpC family hydrolase